MSLAPTLPGRGFTWDTGISSAPPTDPQSLPDSLPAGIAARSYGEYQSSPASFQVCIISDWDSGDILPDGVNPSTSVMNSIQSALDTCLAAGVQCVLRVGFGYQVPPAIKTACGAMTYYTSRGLPTPNTWAPDPAVAGNYALPGGVCPWWHNDLGYWNFYDLVHSTLALAFGAHLALSAVTMALPTTQFQEPSIHQYGEATNRSTVLSQSNPWSSAKENAAFLHGWQSHMSIWAPYGVSCETSYNPIDGIAAKTGTGAPTPSNNAFVGSDSGRTTTLMSTQIATCGRLTILSNHSYEDGKDSGQGAYPLMYSQMYGWRAQTTPFPVPFAVQTETLSKMVSDNSALHATVTDIIAKGGCWIEPPANAVNTGSAGVNNITNADSAGYAPQFLANIQGLYGPVSPGTNPGPGTGNPWDTPDSSVIAASDVLYLIAGHFYGDPRGNQNNTTQVFTLNSSSSFHQQRSASMADTLVQVGNAAVLDGGAATVTSTTITGLSIGAGHTIVADLGEVSGNPSVKINGTDAFNLTNSAGTWSTTATGTQVRAFLAGFMQGEGNVSGKVGDDPAPAHLQLIQQLMATGQAYGVPCSLTVSPGGRGTLTVSNQSYFPRVQAYPFTTQGYKRCPGGHP